MGERMRPVLLFATLSILATVAPGQTFIEPGTFGDSSWRGPLATEAALGTCDADSAEWAHWIESYDGGGGAIARCPADGSDWEFYEFGGGGGGSGTVTSVALAVPAGFTISGSPITTSGTFTLGLSTQTANTVWAGPTTGSAAAPTFRALVAADIPDLSGTYLTAVPDLISSDTTGNAATATALAANGANCSAGSAPLGVDASGAAEGCFDVATQAELDALTAADVGAASTSHASTHSDGGSDEIAVENLATACTSGQVVKSDGAGGLVCGTDNTGGGGGGLWVQETSTKVSLDVNTDSDYDAYIESPNATRLRLKQEGANASGRADAVSFELRHLASGYGARIGIDNNAADFFVDVESASTERQNALYIQAATGRVGLGTSSPSQRLHVRNTGAAFGLFDNSTNSVAFGFGAGTAASFIESSADLLFLRAASYAATGAGVGTETLRTTSTGARVTDVLGITPRATAPATCTIGDSYVDTSGAYCDCTSTNTWTNRYAAVPIGSCV